VTGVAAVAADDAPVDHDSAADARRHDERDAVAGAAERAEPQLRERDAGAVECHADGNVAATGPARCRDRRDLRNRRGQREVADPGHVERRDARAVAAQRPGRTDAHADHAKRRPRGIRRPPAHRPDRGGEGLGGLAGPGRLPVAAARNDASSGIDERGVDLGAAEVDGDRHVERRGIRGHASIMPLDPVDGATGAQVSRGRGA
jgi:hypothetical protein